MIEKNSVEDMFHLIAEIGEKTAGIITTKQVEEVGLYRGILKKYVDEGLLIRESKGIYSLASEFPDEYVILQKRSEKMIFSYGTALFLWGMSDRVPHIINVSVPQGFNSTRIKKDNPKVKFHYVQKKVWDIGITKTETSLGNQVILYDKERCICDLVMQKNDVDKQLYIQALKEYFGGECNVRKILKYAKCFGIDETIREYMELLV